jgi:hypothetical protein
VYYCGLACQQAHILEHKHACTHLLCKSITKKGAVISRLQVQGGSDGVASVELMVLEQELARVHYKVGRLMMASLQAAKYQEAETHFKQALHLYRKVEASRGTLRGAAARVAAGKLADKAADEGPYYAIVDLGQCISMTTRCRCTRRRCRRCAAILRMRARLSFRYNFPKSSLPWAKCTSVNIAVKSSTGLRETRASALVQKL